MQEIKLTSDNNTIHVDDVDVSKGVYIITHTGETCYLIKVSSGLYLIDPTGNKISPTFSSLQGIIKSGNTVWDFYTIPDNKRITTTKAMTVDELSINDYIGFVTDKGEKYAIFLTDQNKDKINAISPDYQELYRSIPQKKVSDLILDNITKSVYKFPTRKNLYKWLAED